MTTDTLHATYYVLLRILNLLLLFTTNENLYFLASAALFAQSSVLIGSVKPYKKSIHNYVDSTLLFTMAITFLGSPGYTLTMVMGETDYYLMYDVIIMNYSTFNSTTVWTLYTGEYLCTNTTGDRETSNHVCSYL